MRQTLMGALLTLSLVLGCTSAPTPRPCSAGCVVRIESSDADVVLAISKQVLDEMLSAGSDRAIAVMVANGSAFLVPPNTPVSVVDRGFEVRKVLVLSGPLSGRTGWLPADWVEDRRNP